MGQVLSEFLKFFQKPLTDIPFINFPNKWRRMNHNSAIIANFARTFKHF